MNVSDRTIFAIPKDRQDVTVRLHGGKALSGSIFLELSPTELTMHQRVLAFLEDEHLFFPLKLAGSGATEFINKENVRLVEMAYAAEGEQDALKLSLMQAVNITVFFVNEQTLNGQLLADVPVEKARLSDCLNLPGRFLSVKENHTICYINKQEIQRVVYAAQP